jgi:hypothetical protein
VTPSLPQRGRHPKGSIPLTPFLYSFCLNRGFFVNLIRGYRNFYVIHNGSTQQALSKSEKRV